MESFKKVLFLDQGMKIKSLKESEKEHLLSVLDKTHWDLDKTARLLKISLQKIKAKIKEYGIRQADSKG
jgi:DNA-binding NtrC family response regulator